MNKNQLQREAINIKAAQIDGPRFSWNFKSSRLLAHMRDGDPELFLNWSTVRESLFVGENNLSRSEMNDIQGTRYAEHVYDTGFGGADQSYHFAHQLWNLNKLDIDVSRLNVIHEFGSGLGAMPLLCGRLGFSGDYIIEDLPAVSLLRDYYLSNVEMSPAVNVKNGRVDRCDLFIAMCSLSEIPIPERYFPFADYYLFTFQAGWDGVDNTEWFKSLADTNTTHDWKFHECKVPDHTCLTGVRI